MESKKISFGFNKIIKNKNDIIPLKIKEDEKVDIIDCFEASTIKIKGAVEEIKEPLIIPLQHDNKNVVERALEIKQKKAKVEEIEKPDSDLTIEELAARELIKEAQNRMNGCDVTASSSIANVPIQEDKLILEGKAESTLEDYEDVPIEHFGMAMLRGMGWKEGMTLGRNPSKQVTTDTPEPRPKGLGLGANKMISTQKSLDKDGKELHLVKGAFAKIIAGAHKGNYCQVVSLDDENYRVIVKISNSNEILTLNEFLVIPVTQTEYNLGIKVINNAKYEEFKEISDRKLKIQQETKIKKEDFNDDDVKTNSKISLRYNSDSDNNYCKQKSQKRDKNRNEETEKYKKYKYDSKPSKKKKTEKHKKNNYDLDEKNSHKRRNKSKKKSKYSNSDSEEDKCQRKRDRKK